MTENSKEGNNLVGWLALIVAFTAMLISAWTTWQNYRASPFSNATHPNLSYAVMGLNQGKEADEHENFETMLYGWVENKGTFPAKDIFINAHLYSDNFEIEIFGFPHQIVKRNNQGVLFKIDAIPPKSQAVFMIKSKIPVDSPELADFDKLPRHKAVFLAAPFVTHVYYEHGEIPIYYPPKWPRRPLDTIALPADSELPGRS